MHDAHIGGRSENNASCMMISGRRIEQLYIIAGFLPHYWLYERFSQFHSCGTYSVLSRSPSIIVHRMVAATGQICPLCSQMVKL